MDNTSCPECGLPFEDNETQFILAVGEDDDFGEVPSEILKVYPSGIPYQDRLQDMIDNYSIAHYADVRKSGVYRVKFGKDPGCEYCEGDEYIATKLIWELNI